MATTDIFQDQSSQLIDRSISTVQQLTCAFSLHNSSVSEYSILSSTQPYIVVRPFVGTKRSIFS